MEGIKLSHSSYWYRTHCAACGSTDIHSKAGPFFLCETDMMVFEMVGDIVNRYPDEDEGNEAPDSTG